jgi:DNA-binding CsgD family transcriptional regulator
MDLTDRQVELVMHLANGLRYKEIADAMGLSLSSVKQTIKRAQKRAGASTVPHLVSLCIQDGELLWNEEEGERERKPAPPAS